MTLCIFDLDNTLINGDSDYAWGVFMVEQELVDVKDYSQRNEAFYQDYCRGELDVQAYLKFVLAPLRQFDQQKLQQLHQQFMQEKILPMMLPKAQALIAEHKAKGHKLLVITATNAFVTRPIVEYLGIKDIIAPEPECVNGRFTGAIVGVASFAEGKVVRLQQWLQQQQMSLPNCYFYSDSHNDLPLLKHISHPVAVDPDSSLKTYAEQHQWPIISLR